MRYLSLMAATAILFQTALVFAADSESAPKVSFKKTVLDEKFRSEGVAVGDYNKDGKLDIAAGFVWYEAPNWTMHTILEKAPEYEPKGYSNSFCTFAEDVNHDGWTDIMVVDFPGTPTWWFENPKNAAGPWKKHTCTPVTNNESPQYADLDGDGRRELICGVCPDTKNPDSDERQMAIIRPVSDPYALWAVQTISAKAAPGTRKYSHGLGVGDINGDGKSDVVCDEGWYQHPGGEGQGEWKFNPVKIGLASDIRVYDFDGDGDQDLLSCSPHAFGIWWHEQLPGGTWKTHEIDMSFSQTHSVWLADVNGDGLKDFVTGKRWWAHAAGDPGVDDPAVICWFELTRKDGRPEWIRHQFDHNSGVGTQFEMADINADGLLDVIISNKKGVFCFHQERE